MKPLALETIEKLGRVAVLMGGRAAEREISIESGIAVFEALKQLNINALAIDVDDSPIQALAGKKIDRVFNVIHGRGGEDGVLQSVLEVMNIPYTGSGVMASALTMDKLRTKLCWLGAGLATPKWYLLKDEKDVARCIKYLEFPVMVKPSQEGSSLGMSKASNKEELIKAINLASTYECDVYAEAWVKGEEYTVSIVNGEALPVIRLQTANEFYDFEAKYRSENTQYHCPCGLSEQQEEQLKELALTACSVVNVTGWGRVDVFIDEAGNSQLIEVNTIPGMTSHSLVPMAAKACGIEFEELVWRILETSINE